MILYLDGDCVLLLLLLGGVDVVVVCEFDFVECWFVDGGFMIDVLGYYMVGWIDCDIVYVSWDCGEVYVIVVGYLYEVWCWVCGMVFVDVFVVFSGELDDISVGVWYDLIDCCYVVWCSVDFFDVYVYWLIDVGEWVCYDVLMYVEVGFWEGWFVLELCFDWDCDGVCYVGGLLLVICE